MLISYLLAGASIWLPLPQSACAQAKSTPIVILFVGNSFLHGKYPPVLNYNTENVKAENFGLPKEELSNFSSKLGGIACVRKRGRRAWLKGRVRARALSLAATRVLAA